MGIIIDRIRRDLETAKAKKDWERVKSLQRELAFTLDMPMPKDEVPDDEAAAPGGYYVLVRRDHDSPVK